MFVSNITYYSWYLAEVSWNESDFFFFEIGCVRYFLRYYC